MFRVCSLSLFLSLVSLPFLPRHRPALPVSLFSAHTHYCKYNPLKHLLSLLSPASIVCSPPPNQPPVFAYLEPVSDPTHASFASRSSRSCYSIVMSAPAETPAAPAPVDEVKTTETPAAEPAPAPAAEEPKPEAPAAAPQVAAAA